ncbi:transposase [Roseomonas terrae]|uniref:Transposase n=1 Tax=Neoroseomonas terrae TaxID=424799 RepID=A0ABS5EKP4_9PROT|nr:transposase [Neoroseomonas terrae]
MRRLSPFIQRIIGGAGYQGPTMAAAAARTSTWTMKIVRRCGRHRFVVLPKRWIVERTLGWSRRARRLTRDFERQCRIAAAFVRMAMIRTCSAASQQSFQCEFILPGSPLSGMLAVALQPSRKREHP